MGILRFAAVWLALGTGVFTLMSSNALACPAPEPALEAGFRQMYNLNFSGAHQTFQNWQKSHPQDPLGYASDAAAYLFAELDRLHVLESDLFTDDEKFRARQKLMPDPTTRAAFEKDLNKVDELTNRPNLPADQQYAAMFSKILANGLRGDYAALIDKRNFAGLSYMKNARNAAQQLLAADPDCYDAYLAVGVENYLLGVVSAPVRWVLRLTGAQTNKQEGLARLRLTAEKGHYLAPYARLLLAVAALRDKDRETARALLQGLTRDFPQNGLYAKELGRIPQ